MRLIVLIGLLFWGVSASPACADPGPTKARIQEVKVYKGTFATVNSFIFSNGRELLVMDVQRKPEEARRLVGEIRKTGLPLLGTLRFVDRWQYNPKTGELKFLSTDQMSPDV